MASKNDSEFSNVSDCLYDWLGDTVEALRKSLETVRGGKGANASGKLSQSIADNIQDGVKQTRSGYEMAIRLNDYYVDVDKGQPRGTVVAHNDIYQWLQDKPNLEKRQPVLPDHVIANLIVGKIYALGTEATHFYSDVMTDKRFKELHDCVKEAGAKDITDNLDNIF